MTIKWTLVVALLLAPVASVAAPAGGQAEQSFKAATEDLQSRFGPASERRMPPPESNAGVAADIAAISRTRELFGSAAFPVAFPDTFNSVCMPLNDLVQRYLRAGLPSDDYVHANTARQRRRPTATNAR